VVSNFKLLEEVWRDRLERRVGFMERMMSAEVISERIGEVSIKEKLTIRCELRVKLLNLIDIEGKEEIREYFPLIE